LNWNDCNKLTAQEWIFPPCISGSFHKLIPAEINEAGLPSSLLALSHGTGEWCKC
jgi:hypothetical protein